MTLACRRTTQERLTIRTLYGHIRKEREHGWRQTFACQEGDIVRFFRGHPRVRLSALVFAALALTSCGFLGLGAKTAKVVVKFDQAGGDNSFAATVYVQEVVTGETLLFPYDPHTPNITVNLKKTGKYVFYARLVEAPDDYHYGYTSNQTVAYGHMTRGGVGSAVRSPRGRREDRRTVQGVHQRLSRDSSRSTVNWSPFPGAWNSQTLRIPDSTS